MCFGAVYDLLNGDPLNEDEAKKCPVGVWKFVDTVQKTGKFDPRDAFLTCAGMALDGIGGSHAKNNAMEAVNFVKGAVEAISIRPPHKR